MRVVAGSARGRRLVAPPGADTRPTSDRVREAVFNALYSDGAIDGAQVLDLFAGSGALGIEALSRGADRATFVESSRRALAAIETNLANTGLASRADVVGGDALRYLDTRARPVDLAFADPPYAFGDDAWADLLERLPAERAVLESNRPIDPGHAWVVPRMRRYGGTVVTFCQRLPAVREPHPTHLIPPVPGSSEPEPR